jgi:ERCC4-type nuclease
MSSRPNIIVDTREKTPWDFEGDTRFAEVVYQKLDTGDYAIEGHEDLCVIERKLDCNELYNNFIKNRKRLVAEAERMKHYKRKFIVIEQSLEDLMNPRQYYVNKKGLNKRAATMPVAVVMSNLVEFMLEYDIHVIFAGDKAQKISSGLLLKAYEMHQKGKL